MQIWMGGEWVGTGSRGMKNVLYGKKSTFNKRKNIFSGLNYFICKKPHFQRDPFSCTGGRGVALWLAKS